MWQLRLGMLGSQWLTNQLTASNVVLLRKLVVGNLVRDVTKLVLIVTYLRFGNTVMSHLQG
jgi:hypothetical protein